MEASTPARQLLVKADIRKLGANVLVADLTLPTQSMSAWPFSWQLAGSLSLALQQARASPVGIPCT